MPAFFNAGLFWGVRVALPWFQPESRHREEGGHVGDGPQADMLRTLFPSAIIAHPPRAMMSANYETGLAIEEDIPAIIAMQDANLHENGGGLSVRQTTDWFRRTMAEMPIVVVRREGVVVGYALATSIAAKLHVEIVQTMLRAFPPSPDCYLYGPVCVAESERGNGLAAMMYREMRERLPARTAMSFVRIDNTASIRANRKMGKRELGTFTHNSETYIVFGFTS